MSIREIEILELKSISTWIGFHGGDGGKERQAHRITSLILKTLGLTVIL